MIQSEEFTNWLLEKGFRKEPMTPAEIMSGKHVMTFEDITPNDYENFLSERCIVSTPSPEEIKEYREDEFAAGLDGNHNETIDENGENQDDEGTDNT